MAAARPQKFRFDTALAAHMTIYSIDRELREINGDVTGGYADFHRICSVELLESLDRRGQLLIKCGLFALFVSEYPHHRQWLEDELEAYARMWVIVDDCNDRASVAGK